MLNCFELFLQFYKYHTTESIIQIQHFLKHLHFNIDKARQLRNQQKQNEETATQRNCKKSTLINCNLQPGSRTGNKSVLQYIQKFNLNITKQYLTNTLKLANNTTLLWHPIFASHQ